MSKPKHIPPRPAKPAEANAFNSRLQKLLEATQSRLDKLKDGKYELRVSTVNPHHVKAHPRGMHTRPYLARRRP